MSNESITGVIQSKRKDGKGVKIDDAWYSCSRNASYFASVNRGDSVTLQFTRNNQWNNCDENIAPVVGQSAAPASGGGGGGFNKPSQFRSVDELIRNDAINTAVAFLNSTEEFALGAYADNIEKLLKTTELFVAYNKGLIDVNATAGAPAPDPTPAPRIPVPPPAPPAPEPEPAPVPDAKSALGAFLGN